MRWGVREEAVLQHQTAALCRDQILEAQAASRGVAFLALLGDRYGSCPLPVHIPLRLHQRLTAALPREEAAHVNVSSQSQSRTMQGGKGVAGKKFREGRTRFGGGGTPQNLTSDT